VPDCFGFQSNAGGLPVKILHYGAIAHTIQDLFPITSPAHVLEIGAGLGYLGYIAWHFKARNYTVLDLPTVAVMSAYFMGTVFGSQNIWMVGEPEPKKFARFYPSTDCRGIDSQKYDLIVSVDGFPELPIPVQDKYLNLIDECLMPNGIFLSINHESNDGGQRRVFDAVRNHGKLRLIARYPFMMRAGYIEEIYRH
jgi:putative sugar O-methyltransferase